ALIEYVYRGSVGPLPSIMENFRTARAFGDPALETGDVGLGYPVAPAQRAAGQRFGVFTGDLGHVAADEAAVEPAGFSQPGFVECEGQGLENGGLAQTGLLQLAFGCQPFSIGLKLLLAQLLLRARLPRDLLAQQVQVDEDSHLGFQDYRVDGL